MKPETSDSLSLLEDLVKKARAAGAGAADALLADGASLSVSWRLGKLESLERSETGDIGLRVFIGKKQAVASSTDRKPQALEELVERAVAMAREAPEDEYCGLADANEVARNWPKLETADAGEFSAEQFIAFAKSAEAAALAVKGVTNSEGAEAGGGSTTISFVASNGFAGQYSRTGYSISAALLAGEGTGMERDSDYASRVFAADLPSAAEIGRKAGERAVKRLGSRKMPSGKMPVVFEPRMAGGLLGHLAGALSGPSVARGTSFLKDKLGQKIFAAGITIIDDPFRPRGLRSRLFDGEGLLPQRRAIIENGVLATWLLDLRSARQLKMKSTAHASRSPGGLPSPSPANFYCEAGKQSPKELISNIKQGFYVTDLMGMGVNGVTGDYSRGAAGFWIENGTIAHPVSEMTIAGNLKDMFLQLSAANDLEFQFGVDAPTLRIEEMTVAGL